MRHCSFFLSKDLARDIASPMVRSLTGGRCSRMHREGLCRKDSWEMRGTAVDVPPTRYFLYSKRIKSLQGTRRCFSQSHTSRSCIDGLLREGYPVRSDDERNTRRRADGRRASHALLPETSLSHAGVTTSRVHAGPQEAMRGSASGADWPQRA